MPTIDDHGALHDRQGRYAEQGRASAGYDLGAAETRSEAVTLQAAAPLARRSMQPSARAFLDHFAMLRQEGMLELDPPYQRGTVWDQDQRRNLFRSFMLGLPVPAIIINDRMSAVESRSIEPYAVIDGKQRIEAGFAWLDGDLDLPATWFESQYLHTTHDTDDGPYVYVHELTKAGRRLLSNHCLIPVAEAKVPTIAEEAEIFGLVNGAGVPVDDETLARAARIATDGE